MLSHMIGRHMYSILRNPVGSHEFLRQSIGNARFDLNHLCQVQSELDRTAPARGLPKQFWGQPDLHSGVEVQRPQVHCAAAARHPHVKSCN